jgi:hypothetical protein
MGKRPGDRLDLKRDAKYRGLGSEGMNRKNPSARKEV